MIRRATLDDVDAILAVVNANTDRLLARDREEIAQLLDGFWVAEVEGQVVGCCCLETYSPKIAELRSLAVLPEFRERAWVRRSPMRPSRRRGSVASRKCWW